jgi:2-methylcitrate dehydratase PrpD
MLLDDYAAYCATESVRALSDEVRHHARRALIDWASALYPGTVIAPGTALVAAHRAELGVGRSSLPGYGTTAFPALAAWINGTVSHTAEMDDIFRDAIYHPGCPTIAAALAVAEDIGATGDELLRAIVIGYEVSTRIGAAVQPAHYRFFHTTGTAGVFGSAAAVSALLAPGRADVALNAMATAATFASGLQQAFRSDAMTKALHAGHAAQIGLQAAQAANHGVTGAADILEGAAGFGAALAGNPSWKGATDGLGTRYNIGAITMKAHACCGHTFAAIDAAVELRKSPGFDVGQVRAIDIDSYQVALDVTGNADPKTAFEGKFSLPFVVSHALVRGAVRLDAFGPERLNDPVIRKLMKKIKLVADPAMTAGFPSLRSARMRIAMADGRTLEHHSPYRKGDPEAPLTDTELDAKFLELVGPVLGNAPTEALLAQLWNLGAQPVASLNLVAPTRT